MQCKCYLNIVTMSIKSVPHPFLFELFSNCLKLLTLQDTKSSCDAAILNKLIFYHCNAEAIDKYCDIITRNITFCDLQESPLLQQSKLNFHNKMITIATVPVSIYEYMEEFKGMVQTGISQRCATKYATIHQVLNPNLPETLPPQPSSANQLLVDILVTFSKYISFVIRIKL